MTLELQKPVDRRFKSDHPHALVLVAVVIFLLVFPVVPMVKAGIQGNESSTFSPSTIGTNVTSSGAQNNNNTCLTKPGPQPLVPSNLRVGVVLPIFTATPYSQYIYGSFYAFYKKYAHATGNITTDLKLLNTSVTSGAHFNFGWGHSYPLYSFLKSKAAENCGLVLGKNLKVISDINITKGMLFSQNGTANYDVLVFGFAEYVSGPEYSQLVKFVAQGGRLVIMGGDSFQVRVYYNPKNQYETYVIGHGYAYNNKTAWRNVPLKIGFDLPRFIGSVDCCFRSGTYSGARLNLTNQIGSALASQFGSVAFKAYAPHEEDSVANFTHTSIIGVFRNSSGMVVAAFAHQYGKGAVVCFCAFADDVILQDKSTQYFAMLAIATPNSQLFASIPQPSQPANNLLVEAVLVAAVVGGVSIAFYLVGRRRASAS